MNSKGDLEMYSLILNDSLMTRCSYKRRCQHVLIQPWIRAQSIITTWWPKALRIQSLSRVLYM